MALDQQKTLNGCRTSRLTDSNGPAGKLRARFPRAWSRVGRYSNWLQIVKEHGTPSTILQFGCGLGDHLLLTCIAHELSRRGGKRVWVGSNYPDIFRHNVAVQHVIPEEMIAPFSSRKNWLLARSPAIVLSPSYAPHVPGERRDLPPEKHILASMCEQAGIRGSVQLRPYLSLTGEEKKMGSRIGRQVVIQTSGRSARQFMWTKEWFPERFQEVANRLKQEVNFVQLGHASDPLIEGAIDLRGQTGIRESAAILANSILFVGLVGFLMHLARAVDCPSAIIYGGRELPEQTGYVCNLNITGNTPCSPCWRYDDCPGGRACMDQIKVDQVVETIRLRLADVVRPLAVQEFVL